MPDPTGKSEPDATDNSDKKDRASEPEDERDKDLRWTKTGFFFFGGFCLGGLLIYSLQYVASEKWRPIARIAGSSLLIACASFLIGALLGFIFAIPRALQGTRPPESGQAGKADGSGGTSGLEYQVNTNLEQISDWLTKIIVGIGLVQLGKMPEYVNRLGDYFGDCFGDAPGSAAIAVVVIIAFLVLGFLVGYLITRLYVTGAFKRAERDKVKPVADIPITARDAGPVRPIQSIEVVKEPPPISGG